MNRWVVWCLTPEPHATKRSNLGQPRSRFMMQGKIEWVGQSVKSNQECKAQGCQIKTYGKGVMARVRNANKEVAQ